MQLTWLDLLAANMGAMLWLWGVMAARKYVETERKKFIPTLILVGLIGFAALVFCARANFWFDSAMQWQGVIVPPVASR